MQVVSGWESQSSLAVVDAAARPPPLRWFNTVCGFLGEAIALNRNNVNDVSEANWLSLGGQIQRILPPTCAGASGHLPASRRHVSDANFLIDLMPIGGARGSACQCGLPRRGGNMALADRENLRLQLQQVHRLAAAFFEKEFCAQPGGRFCLLRQHILSHPQLCAVCGGLSRPSQEHEQAWARVLNGRKLELWCSCGDKCQFCNWTISKTKKAKCCFSSGKGDASRCAKRARLARCASCNEQSIFSGEHPGRVPCPTCCRPFITSQHNLVDDDASNGANSACASSTSPMVRALHLADDDIEPCRPLLVFGRPGTGKSRETLRIAGQLRKALPRGTVSITALTGVLGQRLGGQTLHSWGGLRTAPDDQEGLKDLDEKSQALLQLVKQNRRALLAWQTTRVLVIDDASMLGATLFDMLNHVAKGVHAVGDARSSLFFGGICLVLNVDFHQLLPFKPQQPCQPLFEAKSWPELFDTAIKLHLTVPHRFVGSSWCIDAEHNLGDNVSMLDVLDRVRSDDYGALGNSCWQGHRAVFGKQLTRRLTPQQDNIAYRIYATNDECDKFNKSRLQQLPGEPVNFPLVQENGTAFTDGSRPEKLHDVKQVLQAAGLRSSWINCMLKVGIKVMFMQNTQGRLKHGTLGIVKSFVEQRAAYRADSKLATAYAVLPVVRWSPENVEPFTTVVQPMPLLLNDNVFEAVSLRVFPIFGLPIQSAEALTVHKSQGLTCSFVVLDAQKMFCDHQFYTAISRTPSFHNLEVRNFEPSKCLRVNSEAAACMEQLSRSASEQTQEDLEPFLQYDATRPA